jgi:hypothetical protein
LDQGDKFWKCKRTELRIINSELKPRPPTRGILQNGIALAPELCHSFRRCIAAAPAPSRLESFRRFVEQPKLLDAQGLLICNMMCCKSFSAKKSHVAGSSKYCVSRSALMLRTAITNSPLITCRKIWQGLRRSACLQKPRSKPFTTVACIGWSPTPLPVQNTGSR